MEHELRLATHQQRAGGQDDGSLNKLPQIVWFQCLQLQAFICSLDLLSLRFFWEAVLVIMT